MENWETRFTKQFVKEEYCGPDNPPMYYVNDDADKIMSFISSEIIKARQEGKREERTAMEVFLNNRMAKEYASLHQNNNEQGVK